MVLNQSGNLPDQSLRLTFPNDTDLLVQHLMTLMHPAQRQTMGLEARKLMENHSTDHNFRQFWEIYEKFLATRSRAA